MLNIRYLSVALVTLSQCVYSQQVPSAGSQLQQIPSPPNAQKLEPNIQIKPDGPPAVTESDRAKFNFRILKVTGCQVYSEADLLKLTGFTSGSELTLADLRGMAANIADYYHRNGYFVAQAYLPAQDIRDGVVTIAVIEGHYGAVAINNLTRVSNNLTDELMGGISSGDLVTSSPLESRLLLLSDLPGVKVDSSLSPGATLGTSDLLVTLAPGRSVSGSVDADNAGNRYTGENRIGATVNWNEPFGLGDVASLRVLTSGPGLQYARASYQLQVAKATVGLAYSDLAYELGEEFASLKANGSARVASIYGTYPLRRSRNDNLYVGLVLDSKTFRDNVDSTSSVLDKTARVLTASLNGDHRDYLGGGGLTDYSLAWSTGNIDLQTPAALAVDEVTAHSNGPFEKIAYSLSRLQYASADVSFYAALSGQFASKNLDVSEKMELGGMYGVRAFPEGEAYADVGYLLKLEARWGLPPFSNQAGQVQLIGFVDSGSVTLNQSPWIAGSNQRTLSGAGVGINWSEAGNFLVRAYYACKLGDESALSAPDASGRFWIQAVKYF
jgi:hemolysin activation/secretion protein